MTIHRNRNVSVGDLRYYYLPYCIEGEGDRGWVVLNRRYQPIACDERGRPYRLKGLSSRTRAKLSTVALLVHVRLNSD